MSLHGRIRGLNNIFGVVLENPDDLLIISPLIACVASGYILEAHALMVKCGGTRRNHRAAECDIEEVTGFSINLIDEVPQSR